MENPVGIVNNRIFDMRIGLSGKLHLNITLQEEEIKKRLSLEDFVFLINIYSLLYARENLQL